MAIFKNYAQFIPLKSTLSAIILIGKENIFIGRLI